MSVDEIYRQAGVGQKAGTPWYFIISANSERSGKTNYLDRKNLCAIDNNAHEIFQ